MDTVAKVFGINAPQVAKSGLVGHRCSNPSLIAGVELEIENVVRTSSWFRDNVPNKIWTMERDGSLRPQDLSWEFISKPLELQYLIGEMQSLFDKLKLTPAESYSDRTSVHVHTNVTDFTQQQMATLALVYVTFEDVLFQFVNHYKAPNKDGYCRDTNIYCIPWNQCRMNMGLVNTIFANPTGAFTNWQKYTALNLLPVLNQGTVEWRHMHGTNDMEKLTIWLNLIGSIMKYARNTAFETVVETIRVLNDTSAYQQFFNQVLEERLPYEPNYQQALAEGVINAKFSLINWDKYKGKSPKKATVDIEINTRGVDEDDVMTADELREFNEMPQAAAGLLRDLDGAARRRLERERTLADARRQLRGGAAAQAQVQAAQAGINAFRWAPPPDIWPEVAPNNGGNN